MVKKRIPDRGAAQDKTEKRMVKNRGKLDDQSDQGIFMLRNQEIKAKQWKEVNWRGLDSALRKHDF